MLQTNKNSDTTFTNQWSSNVTCCVEAQVINPNRELGIIEI